MRLAVSALLLIALVTCANCKSVAKNEAIVEPAAPQEKTQVITIAEGQPKEDVKELLKDQSSDNLIDSQAVSNNETPKETIKDDKIIPSSGEDAVAIKQPCSMKEKAQPPASIENHPSDIFRKGIQKLAELRQVANETIQSIVNSAENPQSDSSSGETPPISGPSFLQEAIQNVQNSFQNGIQAINQTVSNFLNGVSTSNQNEETSSTQPPNIFIQGIQSIQENFQNSLSQLNNTLYNYIQGSPAPTSTTPEDQIKIVEVNTQLNELQSEFQNGLKGAEEKFHGIKSEQILLKADSDTSPTSTEGTPININLFQQFINNWQQSLQSSFSNLNATIQNILRPPQSDESNSQPNIFQQGIQNFQNQVQSIGQGIQSFINGGAGGVGEANDAVDDNRQSTTARPANPIVQGIQTIQHGIQNFGQSIQNIIRPPSSSTASPVEVSQPGSNEVPQKTETENPAETSDTTTEVKSSEQQDEGRKNSHKYGFGGGNKDPVLWSGLISNILGQVTNIITTTVTLADNSINRIINTIGTNAQNLVAAG